MGNTVTTLATKVLIIIPAYNEAGSLSTLIADLTSRDP